MEQDKLIEALKKARRTLTLNEICERTGFSKEKAKKLISDCLSEGLIVCPKERKYCLPAFMGLTLCKVRANRNSPAFARPVDGSGDFYLDMPHELAFEGDMVFVRETQGGQKRRGTLIMILKRAHEIVTGTLYLDKAAMPRKRHRSKGRPRYVPEDKYLALINDRHYPPQAIVTGDRLDAQNGDMCVFDVVRWPVKNGEMFVKVKQALGKSDDLGAHLSALCAAHEISEEFTQGALAEADELGEDPRPSDTNGRLDLRGETIFTIDGADAQDFDDAVSLKLLSDGYELGVHIADVSFYVKPGSELDRNAEERGTSVYLPGRTIPMLPEKLCNCLCSLMPNRDRLCYSAIMRFDSSLNLTELKLRPSVIRSCARLTYEDVNEMFAGRKHSVPEELCETLRQMNSLAKKFKARRIKQGSLELDLPEVEFTLGENNYPVDMGVRTRGDAHMLIEEFMLQANQAVAAYAEKRELPFPYRVHEKPDGEKLTALENTLAALNKPVVLGANASQQRLSAVLKQFEGSGLQIIVSEMILRAMSKARYSEHNLGHFGLAFKDYCHFTSPIRRYPDLLAHRMLRMFANTQPSDEQALKLTQSMHMLTDEASQNEERAAACEREADSMMCAAYMDINKKREFRGVLTRFLKSGACVSLENGCEGIIPYRNMDDVYTLDESGTFISGKRSRRMLKLGDRVKVRCVSADIVMGSVEFEQI